MDIFEIVNRDHQFISYKSPLKGVISLPGDKSISHRALICSAISKGRSSIYGLSFGEDILATKKILEKLGIYIELAENNTCFVDGKGLHGFSEPEDILDCENSGTTARLMMGLLSGQKFFSVLTGDNSLRKRPMQRVANSLRSMGAKIEMRKQGMLPCCIIGEELFGGNFCLPVSSAQWKSALMFASLYAKSGTFISEPFTSRDHTERAFKRMGVPIDISTSGIRLSEINFDIKPQIWNIPGDISSAAFFIVAATLIPDSEICIRNIGVNPTRTGILDVLQKMGADIQINKISSDYEDIADIVVKYSPKLKGITIDKVLIPRLIDEIPIISILSAFAKGDTIIKDAEELRYKESDRLLSITNVLKQAGVIVEEQDSTITIRSKGKINLEYMQDRVWNSYGDHRIAMSIAILILASKSSGIINHFNCVNTSFPNFIEQLDACQS